MTKREYPYYHIGIRAIWCVDVCNALYQIVCYSVKMVFFELSGLDIFVNISLVKTVG